MGEPRHPPALFVEALGASVHGLANYPTTMGVPALREVIHAPCACHGRPISVPGALSRGPAAGVLTPTMAAMTPTAFSSLRNHLATGYRNLQWRNVLLLAAVCASIALALWTEDPRPYWHPFITAQCLGFVIAYCVRVASPWDHPTPIRRIVAAVAVGAVHL